MHPPPWGVRALRPRVLLWMCRGSPLHCLQGRVGSHPRNSHRGHSESLPDLAKSLPSPWGPCPGLRSRPATLCSSPGTCLRPTLFWQGRRPPMAGAWQASAQTPGVGVPPPVTRTPVSHL